MHAATGPLLFSRAAIIDLLITSVDYNLKQALETSMPCSQRYFMYMICLTIFLFYTAPSSVCGATIILVHL